ncbi:hypothetical protein CHU98_g10092 [Xylaria longipes]|nr:hypothetical protein CHU98_g10092 [Xylaria longipes]
MVLLVAVEKDSLRWEEGITIALECREILQAFRISNVEVEIREGKYEHHAACENFEAQIDAEGWCGRQTNEAALPTLSFSGYPIGYLEDIKGQGTVGLHLKLSQDKTSTVFYGLTCRHVVDKHGPIHEGYKLSGEHWQYHVQANHTGFSMCLDGQKGVQERLEESIRPFLVAKTKWEEWYVFDEINKDRRPTQQAKESLAELQNIAAYNVKIIEHLTKLEKKDKRKIGHLAYYPNLEISSLRPGYLKDWALIELNPDKFNGFLNLVLRDEEEGLGGHYKVGKRGSSTGLTFGIKSGVEAVIRRPRPDGKDVYAREMLIVPSREYKRFSDRGDSGAVVFDSLGRIVGMVTGSTDARSEEDDLAKLPNEVDVTFAAPIEWVLEDIQDFTGQEARLA